MMTVLITGAGRVSFGDAKRTGCDGVGVEAERLTEGCVLGPVGVSIRDDFV